MKRAVATMIVMCIALLAAEARAGWEQNLRTLPAQPAAGQPFLVVFENTPCQAIYVGPPGLAPTVTLDGAVLSVAVDRIGIFGCDLSVATYSVPVSGLLTGNYTLQLIVRDFQAPENYGLVETIALTVGPPLPHSPNPIPATGWLALGVLGVAILGASLRNRRFQRFKQGQAMKIPWSMVAGIPLLMFPYTSAWTYNLRTSPSAPIASQPFQLIVDDDQCEDFLLGEPGTPPTISVDASTVTVAIDRIEIIDCGSSAVTFTIPMPELPAGTYTLNLVGREPGAPENVSELATLRLVVSPGVAAQLSSIPSGTAESWALLGAALLCAVALTRRWRA